MPRHRTAFRRFSRIAAQILPLEPRVLFSTSTNVPTPPPEFDTKPSQVIRINGTRYNGYSDGDGVRLLVPIAPKLQKSTTDGTFTPAQIRSTGSLNALQNIASLASLSSPGFNITLNLTGTGLTDTIRSAFTNAKARWEQIITTDIPDVGAVDDIQIDATVSPIDGVGRILGQAGPRSLRTTSFLPLTGVMQFDSADLGSLAASGSLQDVVFHEMGHVLGIGTIWSYKSVTSGVGTANPRYTGANAIAAYQALGGTDATVPLENTGGSGTAGAHWRESIFNNEIMTGFLNSGINPASTISIASLIDLGYTVDLNQADAYLIPGLTPPGGGPVSINGSISGTLFADADNDGTRDDGEAPIAGKIVFLDTNNNGAPNAGERFTTTASDGSYAFATLRAGTYNVRTVLPAGTTLTTTTPITLTAGQAATSINVGTFDSTVAISGIAFIDTNNNGTRDTGELAPANRVVFIDTNNNGTLDRTEPGTKTSATGAYAFTNLSAGTFRLRIVLSSGVILTNGAPLTLAAGQKLTNVNLGTFDTNTTVSGVIYNDTNNNGTRDTGELPLAGRIVYIDANANNLRDTTERAAVTAANGAFTFATLPPAQYNFKVVTTVRVTQSTTASVTLQPAEVRSNLDIGLYDANATLSGVLFLDANNNATRDTGELPVSRGVVFLDANNNGTLDTGETTAITTATGEYSIPTLAAGTYRLRAVPPNSTFNVTAGGEVTLEPAQRRTAANVGLFDTTATVTGIVFSDTNNNGARNDGELGLPGVVVYADANRNGTRDANERATSSGTGGVFVLPGILPGTVAIRAVFATGTVHSGDTALTLSPGQRVVAYSLAGFDTTVAISGVVYNDVSNNGARELNETPLPGIAVFLDANNNSSFDTGERTSVTSATGAYAFTGLSAGTFNVRAILPTGHLLTQSPSTLTLAAGVKSTERNFGLFNSTGILTGTVYSDNNKNGTRETSEPFLSAFTVYIDANNNGALDTTELRTVTNRTGVYGFTSVPRGTYTIRPFLTPAITQSQPSSPLSVTITAGQITTATPIGIARVSALRAALRTNPFLPALSTPSLLPSLSPPSPLQDLFSSSPVEA